MQPLSPPPSATAEPGRSKSPPVATIEILGIRFTAVDLMGAIARIGDFLQEGGVHTVSLVNAYCCVMARDDLQFAEALAHTSMNLADGMPIIWASRWLSHPLPQRVAGCNLLGAVCSQAAQQGWRVFFLGGEERTLQGLRASLNARYPTLTIAGVYAPPIQPTFSDEETQSIAERVKRCGAQIIWVGLGAPKQEKWAQKLHTYLEHSVVIGVGAAFDFIAGTQRRAPEWLQQWGCEWLFRLLQEPRRLWKRYLIGNLRFIVMLLGWLWQVKGPHRQPRGR